MACSKIRNNVVLISLGLLFFSLGLCTNSEKQSMQKKSISPSRNLGWHHGKLLIGVRTDGKSKKATDIDLDYQSDMVWDVPGQKMVQEYGFPGYNNAAVERLLKMNPTVDCSAGHMRLQVKDADYKPGSLLFVDRGVLSPISLSKLPKSCGYKVSSTRRDFVMVAPYDGCFVLVQESCYVLPLRWFGLPVQMSCPVTLPSTTSSNTPMVTCHPLGMVITTDWTSALSEIKVNLRDQWQLLTQVSAECNVGADAEEHTIYFPYKSSCVEMRGGMYVVKLSGDVDVKVSCPPLAGSQQLRMDVEQISTPAPTQSVKTTNVPQYDMPQTPSYTWDQFYSWYGQQPAQPVDDKVIEQPFYPVYPEGMSPGFDNFGHYPYPMFQPNMPSVTTFNQEPGPPPQPGNPSVDTPPLYDPAWYWPEPQPIPPFYLPREPVKPEWSPQPPAPLTPEGSPSYPCHVYHTTKELELTTTASPLATVPQRYQLIGPYFHSRLFPHLPYSTTPSPFTKKLQDPPISRPGTVVVFPKHPQPEMNPSMECLQHCQVGHLDCCPQIAFHQHHYHFVPQQQNGDLHSPLLGLPTGLRPDSLHAPSQDPQEAPAPASHNTFMNALVPPLLYPHRGQQDWQTYNQPQEGNPAPLPGNEPRERAESSPAYNYYPNANLHYPFDMNPWNPQDQPEFPSTGAPSHYSEFFDPAQGTNLYDPYNEQSSHQSDGPPTNPQSPNLLSRIRQYASQSANNANIDVKEPALVFRSLHHPELVPYGPLQEHHISNLQPSDALRRTQRGYVLLKHGPPGKERSETITPSPSVVGTDNMGENFARNFPIEPQSLKEESENPKRLDGEDLGYAGQTAGYMLETLPQSAPADPNSADLSQAQQSFNYPQGLSSPFGHRLRTLQHDVSQ